MGSKKAALVRLMTDSGPGESSQHARADSSSGGTEPGEAPTAGEAPSAGEARAAGDTGAAGDGRAAGEVRSPGEAAATHFSPFRPSETEPAERSGGTERSRGAGRFDGGGKRRLRTVAGGSLLGLAGLAAVAGAALLLVPAPTPDEAVASPPSITPTAEPAAADPDTQRVLLMVNRRDGVAHSLTLLTGDGGGKASVVFVPVGTLAEIPGFGLGQLRRTLEYGGRDLVESAVENALGVTVDHTAVGDASSLAAWLDATGGLEVTAERRLVDRSADQPEVIVEPGVHTLRGAPLARFLTFRSPGDGALQAVGRRREVWESLARRIGAQSGLASRVGSATVRELETGADEAFATELFSSLASAQETGELTTALLPVSALGGEGGATSYSVDRRDADRLLRRLVAGSGAVAAQPRLRVQVLNGVGKPGVGEAVASALPRGRFRVSDTGNARSFDVAETKILVYTDTPAVRRAAEDVRSRLGVGNILRSRQPQSVVDLTVVVGSDFDPSE